MMSFYEPEPSNDFISEVVVRACIEGGSRSLLLDEQNLPPAFFDLSTGVIGDLVQRLTLYDIPMAAVVSDLTKHSSYFGDFAREANRGKLLRFLPTRAEAVDWLETVGES